MEARLGSSILKIQRLNPVNDTEENLQNWNPDLLLITTSDHIQSAAGLKEENVFKTGRLKQFH